MLCLGREKDDVIVIGCPQSEDVMFVQMCGMSGRRASIGVAAPREVPVVRLEILLATMEERGQKPSARFLELLKNHGAGTLRKLSEQQQSKEDN